MFITSYEFLRKQKTPCEPDVLATSLIQRASVGKLAVLVVMGNCVVY